MEEEHQLRNHAIDLPNRHIIYLIRAYKIQLVQESKPNDHRLRRIFADRANLKLAEDWHSYRRIVLVMSTDNPQTINDNESQLPPLKLTVRFGSHAGGIISPYFFRIEEGAAFTVNGERYRAMLTANFLQKLIS